MRARLRFAALLLLAATAAAPAQADFEDLGAGARAMGMGNASIGLADDGRCASANPACLGWILRPQMSADYTLLSVGLDDNSDLSMGVLSYVHPLQRRVKRGAPEVPISTAAVAAPTAPAPTPAPEASTPTVRTLIVEGATVTVPSPEPPARKKREKKRVEKPRPVPAEVVPSTAPVRPVLPRLGTLSGSLQTFTLTDAYRETAFSLAYGRMASRRLSWGVALKALQEKYEQDAYTRQDPVFGYGGNSSVQAFSADLGVLWNYRARFFWGASLLDVNRPDVGLQGKELLPMTMKTGIAYRERRTTAALDLTLRDGVYRLGVGAERWFSKNTYAARLGLGLGERDLFHTTLGFTVNLAVVQMDYGFLFPLTGLKDTAGTHRLSFSYRFGKPPKDELEPGSLEHSYYELKEENEELSDKLAKVETEKKKLEEILIEEAMKGFRERISHAKESARPSGGRGAVLEAAETTGLVTHYAQKGDTLQNVAQKYYGSPARWREIYEANKDKVGSGGRLKPGTVILIPQTGPAPARAIRDASAPESTERPDGRKVLKARPSGPAEASPAAPSSGAHGAALAAPGMGAFAPAPPVPTATPAPAPAVTTPAPAPSAKPSPAPSSGGRTHQVAEGETLVSIAKKYYGDEKRWVDIYKANKDKVVRGVAQPGTVLTLP